MILRDAEALRDAHPGIERFKITAQQNINNQSNATLSLPKTSQIYDPNTHSFNALPNGSNEPFHATGPFAYFLTTINVDRLEKSFLITPLANTLPASESVFDIVVVQPTRAPKRTLEDVIYASKLVTLLGGAYDKGKHVGMRYVKKDEDESVYIGKFEEGKGAFAEEYYRANSWEWKPVSAVLFHQF